MNIHAHLPAEENPPAWLCLTENIMTSAVLEENGFSSCAKHVHTDIDLYLILSGECKMDICRETILCRKNDLLLILPNAVHSLSMDSAEPCSFHHLRFRAEYLNKLYFDRISLLSCLTASLHFYHKTAADEPLRSLMAYLIKRSRETDLFACPDVNLSLTSLLLQLLKNCVPTEPDSYELTNRNRHVAFTIEYIQKNYSQKILISDIAGPLHVSARYLSKIFFQNTRLTISGYLNFFRVNKAIELMINTDCSLTEIAMQIGCAGSQHFSKLFLNITGLSPHKYKELLHLKN